MWLDIYTLSPRTTVPPAAGVSAEALEVSGCATPELKFSYPSTAAAHSTETAAILSLSDPLSHSAGDAHPYAHIRAAPLYRHALMHRAPTSRLSPLRFTEPRCRSEWHSTGRVH